MVGPTFANICWQYLLEISVGNIWQYSCIQQCSASVQWHRQVSLTSGANLFPISCLPRHTRTFADIEKYKVFAETSQTDIADIEKAKLLAQMTFRP